MNNENINWPIGGMIDTRLLDCTLTGFGFRINTNVDRVIERVGAVQKLTIHYKNGADFNVSNALDVEVIRRKGGGFDVRYAVKVDYKDDLGGITETGNGTLTYETHSGDVEALTTRMPKVGYTRATEYLEFGGQ